MTITKEDQLIRAARYGDLDLVITLHIDGANIHADEDDALQWATYNEHLHIVQYLLQNGADIHTNDDYVLRWAAYNENLEIVKYLLQQGAKINETNRHLHFVQDNGQYLFMRGICIIGQKELIPEIQLEINKFNHRIVRTKSANLR